MQKGWWIEGGNQSNLVVPHQPYSLWRRTLWNMGGPPESVTSLLHQSQGLLSGVSMRAQAKAVQGILMNTCMGGSEFLHRTSMGQQSWEAVCVWLGVCVPV